MLVRDTARSYGTEKTSPGVRTLDEVKNNALRSRDVASVQNFGRQLCEKTGFEFTRKGALYLMDYLADKAIQNPNEEFTLTAFAQSAILHKISGFAEKSTDSLLKELNKAWKHFD